MKNKFYLLFIQWVEEYKFKTLNKIKYFDLVFIKINIVKLNLFTQILIKDLLLLILAILYKFLLVKRFKIKIFLKLCYSFK